jgi:hypothetical protein
VNSSTCPKLMFTFPCQQSATRSPLQLVPVPRTIVWPDYSRAIRYAHPRHRHGSFWPNPHSQHHGRERLYPWYQRWRAQTGQHLGMYFSFSSIQCWGTRGLDSANAPRIYPNRTDGSGHWWFDCTDFRLSMLSELIRRESCYTTKRTILTIHKLLRFLINSSSCTRAGRSISTQALTHANSSAVAAGTVLFVKPPPTFSPRWPIPRNVSPRRAGKVASQEHRTSSRGNGRRANKRQRQ